MTDSSHARYPGAQPFSDDELSRKTFFGRESEACQLADQILANRLVVVYGKSGLGKTSLLNAGVAQRLRDAGHLPLSVRVNDVKRGPFGSILDGIQAAAERQGIEYVPGQTETPWHFFKTTELWLGDQLLTPVLILDQFEELFTLQSPKAREVFLAELGSLLRGVPPTPNAADDALSEKPPSLRVVLSLREDFLGLLDEAADLIPQILDERFRLRPLTLAAGEQALTRPAAVEDLTLHTRPFHIDRDAVRMILEYLSQRRGMPSVSTSTPFIEPFQLQLVCQRIERLAVKRQRTSTSDVTLTLRDIGGETGLEKTIRDFYKRVLEKLPPRERSAVRLLCRRFLISPEGRRLSVEENELCKVVPVEPDTLCRLVELRLLRSDNRADSTYYELSHDTLVEPIVRSNLSRALLRAFVTLTLAVGALCLVAALIMQMIAAITNLFLPIYRGPEERGTALVARWLHVKIDDLVDLLAHLPFDERFLALVAVGIMFGLGVFGFLLWRKVKDAGREFALARGRRRRSSR